MWLELRLHIQVLYSVVIWYGYCSWLLVVKCVFYWKGPILRFWAQTSQRGIKATNTEEHLISNAPVGNWNAIYLGGAQIVMMSASTKLKDTSLST